MKDKLTNTLLQKCNLCAGDHITVALSGGKDSMVLTHLLHTLKDSLHFTLSAVHIHHGLRSASDDEEQLVRDFCKKMGLALSVFHLDLGDHKGQSTEMAARQARYRIFADFVSEHRYVATAHHLDDCMETFLINLSRGTGSQGLASIPYTRDGLIRPMLDCTREEIDCYAACRRLIWAEDESNGDTYYLRNFMRKEVLPKLKSREDISFERGFAATLSHIRQENEVLSSLAENFGDETRAEVLSKLPHPVLWRILNKRCPKLTRERFVQIAARLDGKDFREQIAGTTFCVVKNGILLFETIEKEAPISPIPLAEHIELPDKTICVTEIHSEFTHFDIDCDTIGQNLSVRSRREGDQITLPHRPSKTLKKLFSEHHIAHRDRQIVLTDENDDIIFVEGFGAAKQNAPTSHTRRALRLTITPKE